jgi:beta-glucosidase
VTRSVTRALLLGFLALFAATGGAQAQAYLSPDERAARLVRQMTLDEKIQFLHTRVGARDPRDPPPRGPNDDVGYAPPVERLGIPALHINDGSLGVANAWNLRDGDEATALPSGLALAASWDPALADEAGAVAGDEARRKGFNVLLAGGVNLVRDPHDGRAFEYAGEDPLLAGTMIGAEVRGIQAQHVVSTVKHFAVNDRETGRWHLSADMSERGLRESDLLAFQIAIERGDPGAVMCAYNKVNGVHACESRFLLKRVLRQDWGYRGWVMSDWGAVHGTLQSVAAGLDQESGDGYDEQVFYGAPLKRAVETGKLPVARLDAMVRAILRSLIKVGALDAKPLHGPIDYAAHAQTAERIAERGTVLLKNTGDLLPLSTKTASIAVIGGHADIGVLSGGGSSQVRPLGGPALTVPAPPGSPPGAPRMVWIPGAPLAAIKAAAPAAHIAYADGGDIAAAASLAAKAEVAIVFAYQWESEGWDVASLALPAGQDQLIAAVASANKHTIVVLETGGPVLMPWLDRVGAVLEAWYPGQRGGAAIARILFGAASPSGHLPVSFPLDEAELPPSAASYERAGALAQIAYSEGADAGYRWYALTKAHPLFPFGYGLSYTRFAYSDLRLPEEKAAGAPLVATVTLRNTGRRAGATLVQLYVSLPGDSGAEPPRLAAWRRVALASGAAEIVSLTIDPHVLKRWDAQRHRWEMPRGSYRVTAGASAEDAELEAVVALR